MSLVIVDTGCANLASVKFAFDRLGAKAVITDEPAAIQAAERVILPGVGAAPYAIAQIKAKGLTQTLQGLTQPVLGICLGMQLIFEQHEENGGTKGLGLVPGQVSKLDTGHAPSPHMGWNQIELKQPDPLLDGIKTGDYAYFVHSYAAPVSETTLASATYGETFSAIVRHKNVWGCQFHPERSSTTGAQILKNFLDVTL
jgi:glutamine amidotransferase